MSMFGSMLAGGVKAASKLNNIETSRQKEFDLATSRREMDAIYEQKIYDRNKADKATDTESARAITIKDAATKREQQLSDIGENRDYLSGEKALDREYKKDTDATSNLRSSISGETALLKAKGNDIKILQLSYNDDPSTFNMAALDTARKEQKSMLNSIKSKLARLDGGSASNFDPSKLGGNKDKPVYNPIKMPAYLNRPDYDTSKTKADKPKSDKSAVKVKAPAPLKVNKPEEAKAISEEMLKNPNAYVVGQAAAGTVKIVVKSTGRHIYIPLNLYRKFIDKVSNDAWDNSKSTWGAIGSGMLNSGSK